MKARFRIGLLFILLHIFATACDIVEEDPPTVVPGITSVSNELIIVSLADLSEDPAAYEGAYLQLEGQYRRLPLLFCSDDPHPAPSGWELVSDNIQVRTGGFDSQLRSLLNDGQPMTVNGRWRRWQGLVGCGSRAVEQQIWYLQVDDIVSPDPIVAITPTPDRPTGEAVAIEPTPTLPTTTPIPTATTPPDSEPTETVAAITPTASPTSTLSVVTVGTVTTTITSTPLATASSTSQVTPTPTLPQPSPSPTPTSTTIGTPSPTGTRSTTVPTATSMTATATQPPLATATTSTSNFSRIDQGTIDAEELVAGLLNSQEIHSWSFTVDAGEVITASAIAPATGDVVISIFDEAGDQLIEQNQAAAGLMERLAGYALVQAGTYRLEIRVANGAANPYALILLFSDSYNFVSRELVEYDSTAFGILAEESDHFWFFQGNSGDSVSIFLTPNDDGDLFLELYGTNGDRVSDFVDEGIGGEAEQLLQFILNDNGIYAIRVGEYEFHASDYQLELLRN